MIGEEIAYGWRPRLDQKLGGKEKDVKFLSISTHIPRPGGQAHALSSVTRALIVRTVQSSP